MELPAKLSIQQYVESQVPGVKIISTNKSKLIVQFVVTCGTESSVTFTMELKVENGIPSVGRNDLPVFLPSVVIPRIRISGVCESLQVILDLLEAYMSRKMQVKEMQKKCGKYVTGKIQYTLPYTYVEFTVHVKGNAEGMLCLGLHYSLLGTLPELVKAQWKVSKGPVKEVQSYFEEEIKLFLEKEICESFLVVFGFENEPEIT